MHSGSGTASSTSAADHNAARATLRPAPPSGLREAALQWSKAFLTGSPHDIFDMEGPECLSDTTTTFSEKVAENYLKGERAVMRRHFGVDLAALTNHGVEVRNFTPIAAVRRGSSTTSRSR